MEKIPADDDLGNLVAHHVGHLSKSVLSVEWSFGMHFVLSGGCSSQASVPCVYFGFLAVVSCASLLKKP